MNTLDAQDYVRKYTLLVSLIDECENTAESILNPPTEVKSDEEEYAKYIKFWAYRLTHELKAAEQLTSTLECFMSTWPDAIDEVVDHRRDANSWSGFSSDLVAGTLGKAWGVSSLLSEACSSKIKPISKQMYDFVLWDIIARIHEAKKLVVAMNPSTDKLLDTSNKKAA